MFDFIETVSFLECCFLCLLIMYEWPGYSACSPAFGISLADVFPYCAALPVAVQWHPVVALGLHFSSGWWCWHLMMKILPICSLASSMPSVANLIELTPLMLTFRLDIWFANITSWSTVYIVTLFLYRGILHREKHYITLLFLLMDVFSSKLLRCRSKES